VVTVASFLVVLLAFGVPVLAQSADTSSTRRVQISIAARQLWVIDGVSDTIFTAPVAVGSDRTLQGGSKTWKFSTPVGATKVVVREENPIWIPPEWHYVELAKARGLRLERLDRSDTISLSDGRRLLVRGATIGVVQRDTAFHELVEGEEVVFDGTPFIPPFGTRQRRVKGVLGSYRLLLANGVRLHGTPFKESIGKAATHGCIRLHDHDIAWLYDHRSVGVIVLIY
jgi:hypothetical protein